MSAESLGIILPTFLWLVVIGGFILLAVNGLGIGIFILFLRDMNKAISGFNRQTEETLTAFQELREVMLQQSRATEAFRRQRKEARVEREQAEAAYPEYNQDWRTAPEEV